MSRTAPHSDSVPYPFPAARYFCQAWWTCRTAPRSRHTYRIPFDALLATSDDISVILPPIRHLYDIVVSPEPLWRHRRIPTWHGIPCRLSRAEMWLPVEAAAGPLRPFSLLVRVPMRVPADTLPYILLGTQFLHEYKASVEINASSGSGSLVIPP